MWMIVALICGIGPIQPDTSDLLEIADALRTATTKIQTLIPPVHDPLRLARLRLINDSDAVLWISIQSGDAFGNRDGVVNDGAWVLPKSSRVVHYLAPQSRIGDDLAYSGNLWVVAMEALLGDVNLDCQVDVEDSLAVRQTVYGINNKYDLNGNGLIDMDDIDLLADNMGEVKTISIQAKVFGHITSLRIQQPAVAIQSTTQPTTQPAQ